MVASGAKVIIRISSPTMSELWYVHSFSGILLLWNFARARRATFCRANAKPKYAALKSCMHLGELSCGNAPSWQRRIVWAVVKINQAEKSLCERIGEDY